MLLGGGKLGSQVGRAAPWLPLRLLLLLRLLLPAVLQLDQEGEGLLLQHAAVEQQGARCRPLAIGLSCQLVQQLLLPTSSCCLQDSKQRAQSMTSANPCTS